MGANEKTDVSISVRPFHRKMMLFRKFEPNEKRFLITFTLIDATNLIFILKCKIICSIYTTYFHGLKLVD